MRQLHLSPPVDDAEDGIVGDLTFLQLLDPAEQFRFGFPSLFDSLRQFPVLEKERLLVQFLLKERRGRS